MPAGFDGQLGPALLDAVIQQLGLWDRLVQVWNRVTAQSLQVPDHLVTGEFTCSHNAAL